MVTRSVGILIFLRRSIHSLGKQEAHPHRQQHQEAGKDHISAGKNMQAMLEFLLIHTHTEPAGGRNLGRLRRCPHRPQVVATQLRAER